MTDRVDELLAEGQRRIATADGYGPYSNETRALNSHLKRIAYEIRCELNERLT